MDLSIFTPEYIATTPADKLSGERKALIRYIVQAQVVIDELTKVLTKANAEQEKLTELAALPAEQRDALIAAARAYEAMPEEVRKQIANGMPPVSLKATGTVR